MTDKSRLSIITPVFDPSGQSAMHFQKTVDSVISQTNVEVTWHVSFQGENVLHRQILSAALRDASTSTQIVIRESQALSLAEHLSEILNITDDSYFRHILCQDDYYTFATSAQIIANSLLMCDFVHIHPFRVSGVASQELPETRTCSMSRFSRWDGLQVRSAVNRLGGLSCLAWAGPTPWTSLDYSLYADLEIMMRFLQANLKMMRLMGGAVTELIWQGQSQHFLKREKVDELTRWSNCHNATRSAKIALKGASVSAASGEPKGVEVWLQSSRHRLVPIGLVLKTVGLAASVVFSGASKLRMNLSRFYHSQ